MVTGKNKKQAALPPSKQGKGTKTRIQPENLTGVVGQERYLAAARLRREGKSVVEIAEILGATRTRTNSLVRLGERLLAKEVVYQGKIAPPVVRLAMSRGGFKTPEEVAAGIRDGGIRLLGGGNYQSTISGIGEARFAEMCRFFEINLDTLPSSIPLEKRVSAAINDYRSIDNALAEVIGRNAHVRRCMKLIARITGELTQEGLARLQRWGRET